MNKNPLKRLEMSVIKGVIFLAFVVFTAEVKGTKTACCEDIKVLLKNKTIAYQTVCSPVDSRLSSNCCRDIETEIEKHRFAYKMLCPPEPHPTMVIPTGLYIWKILLRKNMGITYALVGRNRNVTVQSTFVTFLKLLKTKKSLHI